MAVGDYLERSQMVLIELANSNPKGPLDITSEQERAGDLVTETRLYRQTAAHTGDTAYRASSTNWSACWWTSRMRPARSLPRTGSLRQRLEADGILFKIRVLGSNVRNQDVPAAQTAGQKL